MYFFIGPESDHALAMLVSDSLPNSCLINLMPVNDARCLMMSQQVLKAVQSLSRLGKLSTNDKQRKTLASRVINYISKAVKKTF